MNLIPQGRQTSIGSVNAFIDIPEPMLPPLTDSPILFQSSLNHDDTITSETFASSEFFGLDESPMHLALDDSLFSNMSSQAAAPTFPTSQSSFTGQSLVSIEQNQNEPQNRTPYHGVQLQPEAQHQYTRQRLTFLTLTTTLPISEGNKSPKSLTESRTYPLELKLSQQQFQQCTYGGSLDLNRSFSDFFTTDPLSSPEVVTPASDRGYTDMVDDEYCFWSLTGSPKTSENKPLEQMDMSRPQTEAHLEPLTGTESLESMFRFERLPLFSELEPSSTLQQYQLPQFDSLSDSDASEHIAVPPMRRRVRKSIKDRHEPVPRVKLYCKHPGCQISFSSQASLNRHTSAHAWKGLFPPLRCEGCDKALSNEFSVQRHILRAEKTSHCYRMRVYSIMRSKTEVENTVRFYPKGPHGKKTVQIDLIHARMRYPRPATVVSSAISSLV
ncbi:hypothetical protein BG011_001107 [Mortierella polycephala]|uniref:C2H2-type domain-containing protein n=1 Tax=Mortierella polycephala TaxID=41804 RepID=A0A9P6Q5V1_9FUNG|nr:hypothetical protein BG011_001107 [Mortierella polycephala]